MNPALGQQADGLTAEGVGIKATAFILLAGDSRCGKVMAHEAMDGFPKAPGRVREAGWRLLVFIFLSFEKD